MTLLLSLAGGLVVMILGKEYAEWGPKLTGRLIDLAVAGTAAHLRHEFRREIEADIAALRLEQGSAVGLRHAWSSSSRAWTRLAVNFAIGQPLNVMIPAMVAAYIEGVQPAWLSVLAIGVWLWLGWSSLRAPQPPIIYSSKLGGRVSGFSRFFLACVFLCLGVAEVWDGRPWSGWLLIAGIFWTVGVFRSSAVQSLVYSHRGLAVSVMRQEG